MTDPIAPGSPGLDRLERWMLAVVSHPDGVEAGWERAVADGVTPEGARELADVVPGNDRLTPVEQLDIYAFMYFERMTDVMVAEYPTVRFLFGDDGFQELSRAFLVEHPSASYTLNRLSAGFAAHLAAEARRSDDPERSAMLSFAAGAATVERAMDEIWDAPYEDPIAFEELKAVPMDRWADARLQTIEAMQLLSLDHPVDAFLQARADDRYMRLPDPAPSWLCVYRGDDRRFRLGLTHPQFVLLSALRDGGTLGDALEQVAAVDGVDFGALVQSLGTWFQEWMGSGLFCGLRLGSG